MKKIYVIDTNVLIQSPDAIENFEDNAVVIPLVVVEELDGLKKADGDKGANARAAVRLLEKYRNEGNLLKGIKLESGGSIRIEKNYRNVELPEDLPEDKSDNRILKVCKGLKEDNKSAYVCLVTKDLVLRLKAQIIGLNAEDYTTEQIRADDANYSGRSEVYIPDTLIKEFKKKGIDYKKVYRTDDEGNAIPVELTENEFIILKSDTSTRKTLLGRVEGKKIVPLVYKKSCPYGISPRNVGQYFMQEALMTDAERAPFMRPIIDNLEQILDSDSEKRYEDEAELSDKIEEVFERGIIQTEALNFIRGRSIVKTYLIIDEAQNMTPNQVKGIITRAGKGTKIILLGDPKQIDKPFLDEKTNGLSYAAKYMKGSPYCWQITLSADECERSELAMDAVKRL